MVCPMLILPLYKVSIKRQPRAPDQSSRTLFSENTNLPRDYDFPALVTFAVCSFEREKITFSLTCITDVISLSFFSFLWIQWQSKKKPSQGHLTGAQTSSWSHSRILGYRYITGNHCKTGQRVRDNEPALVARKNTAKFQILRTVVNEKCLT